MANTPASPGTPNTESSNSPKKDAPPRQPATPAQQASAGAATKAPTDKPPEGKSPKGKAPKSSISPVRRVFELIGVGLLALGLGVGGTWLWWMLKTSNLQEAHQNELQQANARVEARSTDLLLLDAHRWLHRCVVALDQHNFGTARAHAKRAAERLQSAAQSLQGQPDHARVLEAHRALRAISPEISADVGGQRAKFLAVAEQVDALLARRAK